ncbi:hypothetical protein GCM10028793_03500 [Nocardiopsis oceani]
MVGHILVAERVGGGAHLGGPESLCHGAKPGPVRKGGFAAGSGQRYWVPSVFPRPRIRNMRGHRRGGRVPGAVLSSARFSSGLLGHANAPARWCGRGRGVSALEPVSSSRD